MSDIQNRVRIAMAYAEADGSFTTVQAKRLADQINGFIGELERENAALQAELLEEARVNGKGGEREAKLLAENAALRAALERWRALCEAGLEDVVPDWVGAAIEPLWELTDSLVPKKNREEAQHAIGSKE